MKRILVADDHYVVRQGLKQILADKFEDIEFGESCDGNETLHLIWKENWDVLLLDIVMPGRGGLDTLKEVLRSKPALPVIILSMHAESLFAIRALKLGAFAYIRKDSAGHELIDAVCAAFRGQRYITSAVAEELTREIQGNRSDLPHLALSDREYQVFVLLGSGKTVKEVAAKLSLSDRTVSTYRTRSLEKLGMKNNSQITHYVVSHRLSTGEEEE